MDLPEIKFTQILKSSESAGRRQVVKSTKRRGDSSQGAGAKKLVCGTQEIFDIVICLECVPDPVHGVFFPAGVEIAAEDLEDF